MGERGTYTLRKTPKFHLISWCGKSVGRHSFHCADCPKLCGTVLRSDILNQARLLVSSFQQLSNSMELAAEDVQRQKSKEFFLHTKALCLEVKCSEMELLKGKLNLQIGDNQSTIHDPPSVTQKYQSQHDGETR